MRFQQILFLLVTFLMCGVAAIAWPACQGDLNCDGGVDGSDLFKFARSFASSNCGSTLDSVCGAGDGDDLIALAGGFGESGFENYSCRSAFTSSRIDFNGQPLMLTGIIKKPAGDGPFPAVVVLHGCKGINKARDLDWVQRLVNWGYVTIQVDSLGPRCLTSVCGGSEFLDKYDRAQDAHDAKAFLAELSFVDQDRIAVLGWSNGGGTILVATDANESNIYNDNPFSAAIAFYPYCSSSRPLERSNAPLLILIGEKDDWCPAIKCSNQLPAEPSEYDLALKIYPGAYHDFDWEGIDTYTLGHRLLYDPEATADAINRVRSFLDTH